MSVYTYFVAAESITHMKSEYPAPHSMIVVVNAAYPVTDDLKFFDWHASSTDTPDDIDVVKPDFPEFATTGRWLSVEPDTSPQLNADWTASSGATAILHKPALADVATTGLYVDLLSKPSLATVATSGSYNDLSNKPSIPSAYTFPVGTPNTLSVSLGTAYQATNTAKPSEVTINLTSTAALTIGGGSTFEADIVIGSTSAVASGTGTVIGKYKNSLTGTLVIGVAINNAQTTMHKFSLPTGWYFAVRQITGSGITVVSAFDQSIG